MNESQAKSLRKGSVVRHNRQLVVVSGFWRDSVLFRTKKGNKPYGHTLIRGVSNLAKWELVRR